MDSHLPSTISTHCTPEKVIKFDWENKWLKGEEYAHILRNSDSYSQEYNFKSFPSKTHPKNIYISPINGVIYFVDGLSVGSEFGFPRLHLKKQYKWKKMNFTTDLPKSSPIVSYIVASAVKCEKFFPGCEKEGPCFRMHAVILKNKEEQNKLNNGRGFILCHVRRVRLVKNQEFHDSIKVGLSFEDSCEYSDHLEHLGKRKNSQEHSNIGVSPYKKATCVLIKDFKQQQLFNSPGKDSTTSDSEGKQKKSSAESIMSELQKNSSYISIYEALEDVNFASKCVVINK